MELFSIRIQRTFQLVSTYCLDNPQCFNRRYTTLEKALLHCLNGFNENAAIKDRYHSIGEYLLQK